MAPGRVSTCRSRSAKGEWVEKVSDCEKACGSRKGIISDMQVIEGFESRPHKAVTFVVRRRKERQEWNEQQLPKALPGYSGGRLPGRNTKKEKKAKKANKGRKHEKIEGIRSSQRMAFERQNPIRRWDCLQIEIEEEESWQEGDRLAGQLEVEQHLDDLTD